MPRPAPLIRSSWICDAGRAGVAPVAWPAFWRTTLPGHWRTSWLTSLGPEPRGARDDHLRPSLPTVKDAGLAGGGTPGVLGQAGGGRGGAADPLVLPGLVELLV